MDSGCALKGQNTGTHVGQDEMPALEDAAEPPAVPEMPAEPATVPEAETADKHEDEMRKMKEQHKAEMAEMKRRHEHGLRMMQLQHEHELIDMQKAHDEVVREMERAHHQQLTNQTTRRLYKMEEERKMSDALKAKHLELQKTVAELKSAKDALEKAHIELQTEVNDLKQACAPDAPQAKKALEQEIATLRRMWRG